MIKINKYYRYFIILIIAAIFSSVLHNLNGSIKNPLETFKLINLKFPVNSSGDDFSPSLTADGKTMVFNSKLPKEFSHNIYISYFEKGRWHAPEYITAINSKFDNDETPFITPDGTMIIFASDRKGSLRPKPAYDGRERVTFDLYYSRKTDGKWSEPEKIPGEVNTIENERSPCLSPDMKTLYFTRWPFKNMKKAVIMAATFKKGLYRDVKALPPPVNTGNYEIAFTPSRLRSGFYFSSRRPGGFGGWDIYFVHYVNGQFTRVINLGPEINSDSNELFFSEIGKNIFFCSNREGGFGRYDIYFTKIIQINIPEIREKPFYETEPPKKRVKKTHIKKEQPVNDKKKPPKKTKEKKEKTVKKDTFKKENKIVKISPHIKKNAEQIGPENRIQKTKPTKLRIKVIKKQREIPLSARFKIFLKDSNAPGRKPLRSIVKRSNRKGIFYIVPKPDVKWIEITINQKGYKPYKKTVKVERGKIKNVRLEISPVSVRKRKPRALAKKTSSGSSKEFVFKPIYFGVNSTKIKLEFYPYIHRLINYLRHNKDIRIEITGHSDPSGTPEYNNRISYKRAKVIRDYFVKLGLDPGRFVIKGLGEKNPVFVNHGRKYSDYNRRVEFRVIEEYEID